MATKAKHSNANINPFNSKRETLRKTIAVELKRKLEADAFYAAHFFKQVKQLQSMVDSDGEVEDPTLLYDLLLDVVGDHEEEVKAVVGTAVEPVFSFLTEVLASNDTGDSDSLGE